MEEHQLAINKAKIQLMSRKDTVFFTTVLFSLVHIWDDTIPTACTNGKEIRFNPAFFMSLSPEERLFLLLHETLHVALIHMSRLKERDHRRWNAAADYVINAMLIERGFKMPTDGLYDPQYTGMHTEEVYALLEDKDPIKLPMMDLSPPPEDCPDIQEAITDILVRASIQSRQQGDTIGTIPGEIQVYINNLLSPKLPWQRIFQKYMSSIARSDYSFRKPNRRYLPKHYLPSLYNDALMDVAWGIDMSGSVEDHETTVFVSEMSSIFKMLKPEKMTLIQFDTEIKDVKDIKTLQALRNTRFTGRGGTDIKPLMQWAIDHKPQLLVVFTDGHFHAAPKHYKPKCPVIWVIHNNKRFTAPFGKVIHYEI